MAAAKVADRGSANPTSSTTLPVTLTNPTLITVGNHLIARLNSASTRTLTSITDARNTWQIDRQAGVGTNHSLAVASCRVATAYQASDVITFNFDGGATVKAGVIEEYSGLAATSWAGEQNGGAEASGSASWASGNITTTQAACLIYGVLGYTGTATTYTPAVLSPTWTELTTMTTDASGVARSFSGHYRVVSATETVQYAGTLGTSRINQSFIVAYKEATSSGTTANAGAATATGAASGPGPSPAATAQASAGTALALNATASAEAATEAEAGVASAIGAAAGPLISPVTVAVNAHTTVVTGWTNPENAYALTGDDVYATAQPVASSTISGDFGVPDILAAKIPDGASIGAVRLVAELGATDTGLTLGVQGRLNGADSGSEVTKTTTAEEQIVATLAGVTLADLRDASTDIKGRIRATRA